MTNSTSLIPKVSLNPLIQRRDQQYRVKTFSGSLRSINPFQSPAYHIETEEFYRATTSRNVEGRYIVRLPFKHGESPLGDNRKVAFKRFLNQEKRFNENKPMGEKFREVINEYFQVGHLVPATTPSNYILPYHCVFKESSTTSLRVVFDASCKDENGKSLNSKLSIGEKLQQDLNFILINFRLRPVALVADIKQMYRMIELHPDDRKFQHIYYRQNAQDSIQEYELTTLTFGLSCAPFLAIRTLRQLVYDEGEKFEKASAVVLKKSFVDDLATSVDSIQEASQLKNDLIKLLSLGGFILKKWMSSHPDVLKDLPHDFIEQGKVFKELQSTFKILGMKWAQDCDSFYFHVEQFNGKLTKRSIISYTAKWFDPLGLISPILFYAKYFIKLLWLAHLDWDKSLSKELRSAWIKFVDTLPIITQIKIPRYVFTLNTTLVLVGFSDASERGYSSTVYIRASNGEGIITSNLLMAKSKVASMKALTIPKLELEGAVLLSKLIRYVLGIIEMTISRIILFSDSTTVLSWIQSPPHLFKTFVANRVAKVQELTCNYEWSYIASKENPSDLNCRGVLPSDFINDSHIKNLWFHGPKFLHEPLAEWPLSYPENETEKHPEFRKKSNISLTVINKEPSEFYVKLILNCSSFERMLRVCAYFLRFIHNIKNPKNKIVGSLRVDELRKSHDHLFQFSLTGTSCAECFAQQRRWQFLTHVSFLVHQAEPLTWPTLKK